MAGQMTKTTDKLRRLSAWLQAPPNWPPLTESERKALRKRLEDADGKDSAHNDD